MQATMWGERQHLDEEALREMQFWAKNFESCHGQPIWLVNPKPEVLTYSDASDTGWGGGL